MTEEEASEWLRNRNVSRETLDKLNLLHRLIEVENQNLIAPSTMERFRARHIVDSLQLASAAPADGIWIDIGSGGGFPGIPIALVRPQPMILVESRRLRASFLHKAIGELALGNVEVIHASVERLNGRRANVISARAVGALDKVFAMAAHLSSSETRWVLPKGRNAAAEVEIAHRNWHARIGLIPSVTQEGSMIVVADQVSRRKHPLP